MPPGIELNEIGNLFLYFAAFLGAFIAALWLSLIFWAYRDAKQRTEDRLAHILAAVVVAILGPPGLVIYLILRPGQTLDEAYQHALEEEALLSEIEDRSLCPGCGARVRHDWQVCPSCQTRLHKPCENCGQLMELSWQICPYCASPASSTSPEAVLDNEEL